MMALFWRKPTPPPGVFVIKVTQRDDSVIALRLSGLLQRRLTHLENVRLLDAGVLARWPAIEHQRRNLTIQERLDLQSFADEVLNHG